MLGPRSGREEERPIRRSASLDLAMPDIDGFSATANISRVAPEVAVLVLTMSDDDVTVTKAMRAGARGYLLMSNQRGDHAGRDRSRRPY